MQKISLLLLATAFLMLGCKKDGESPTMANNSYQPTTKGSYWKYNNVSAISSNSATKTITGQVETINGKTYYRFQTSGNGFEGTAYYTQQNGDYFVYQVIPGAGIQEELYLKENAAVGEKWIYRTGSLFGSNYRIIGEIVEKGISHSVNGKTYSNVIHTHLLTQYAMVSSDDFKDVDATDYYLAKGVGIIELKASSNNLSSKLVEYEVR